MERSLDKLFRGYSNNPTPSEEQLAQPEISFSERLSIAEQLRVLFGAVQEQAPPDKERCGYMWVVVKFDD